MKILLDENFPFQLHRKLQAGGYDAEHIVVLGARGLPDAAIRRRLTGERLLFITNDVEFLANPAPPSLVMVSRVPQDLPIARRVGIWVDALRRFLESPLEGDVFEILESGEVVPWMVRLT